MRNSPTIERKESEAVANAMGQNYKSAYNKRVLPNVKDRLNTKITLTPHFTAFVTSHGKTKLYLHRFKIIVPRLPLRERKPNGRPPSI
jgi:hypothetical protein